MRALQRENFEVVQASLVKDTMKRKRPAFSEAALGFGSFSEMLEEARDAGLVTLRRDERSGTWVVTATAGDEARTRPRQRSSAPEPGPRRRAGTRARRTGKA